MKKINKIKNKRIASGEEHDAECPGIHKSASAWLRISTDTRYYHVRSRQKSCHTLSSYIH